jgi:hypothetical protein
MGTINFIGCYDCNVYRDLDKLGYLATGYGVKNRKDAIEFSKDIQNENYGSAFKAALLVSFCLKHKSHKIVFFDEHEDSVWEYFVENAIEESAIFWEEQEGEKFE